MKRYNPQETMPDEDTAILAYFGKKYGYIVVFYTGSDWVDTWGESLTGLNLEYWIDLDDIESNLK